MRLSGEDKLSWKNVKLLYFILLINIFCYVNFLFKLVSETILPIQMLNSGQLVHMLSAAEYLGFVEPESNSVLLL